MFSTLVHELTYSQINKLKPYIYDLYTDTLHWFTFEDGDGYSRLVIWFESDSKAQIAFTESDMEYLAICDVVESFIDCGCVYGTGQALMIIPELKEEMRSIIWHMYEENMMVEA